MKQLIEQRAVDELGRIVLPLKIRQELGIETKDVMDIALNDDTVVLKKSHSVPHCAVCGTANDLKELPTLSTKHYICPKCISAVNALK